MNPLLFIPSVREIPEVIDSWNELPYDKHIVRMRLEKQAYLDGYKFFMEHTEYTHIVICPDDLIIHYDAFEELKLDIEEYDFDNLCGICLVDEDSTAYACKPLGVNIASTTHDSFFHKEATKNIREWQLLPDDIFEVAFTGFACQWIDRETMGKLSFGGGCEEGKGCMDLLFAREMKDMNKPLLVHPNTYFTHLRNQCKEQVRVWKDKGTEAHVGYEIYLKDGEKYTINSIT